MLPRTLSRACLVSAALVLSCGVASADTLNMAVSATVLSTCRLITVPAMSFGNLDLVTPVNLTVPVTVTYKCTSGQAPTGFTVGTVASPFTGSLASGANRIAYQIGWTNPTTAGTGLGAAATAINVTLTGTMTAAAYSSAAVGSYTQSVPVSITP